MIEVIFEKMKKYSYFPKEGCLKESKMHLLFTLLRDSIAIYDFLKEKIEDPACTGTGIQCLNIDLKETVAILWLDYELEDEIPSELEINRNHLLELLLKWKSLVEQEVQEIVIRRDGEHFEIEKVR